MKDSGVEWIGEIPEDWELVKIKHISKNDDPNSFIDGDWIESDYIKDEGIRYITTGNIGDGKFVEQGNSFVSKEDFDLLKCKYAYPGDLVFSRLNAPYGRSCILPRTYNEYVIAVDNVILRPTESYHRKFINYLTQCLGYQMSVKDSASGTTMQRISRSKLGNIPLPFPDIEDQQQIVIFLDQKIQTIDNVISVTQQQLAILEDYKKSVITEAVTKGLDKNVEMKDSGIEWIGEIPKNWDVVPLKHVIKYNEQLLAETTRKDYEFQYIDIGSVEYGKGLLPLEHMVFGSAPSRARRMVKDGDIIISTVRTYLKAISVVPKSDTPIIVSTGFITIRSSGSVEQAFLKYLVQSERFISEVVSRSVGVSYPAINPSDLVRIKIVLPTQKDRLKIIRYLDKRVKLVDDAIAAKQQQLTILEDYKKSLIYEYVTGKKEVGTC